MSKLYSEDLFRQKDTVIPCEQRSLPSKGNSACRMTMYVSEMLFKSTPIRDAPKQQVQPKWMDR